MQPRKQRWLWPSSESRFLRHERYQTIHYSTCTTPSEHILVNGSDDEGDDDSRRAKRRRVLKIGRAYLAGQPIFIPSASLKGPFGAFEKQSIPQSSAPPSSISECIDETTYPEVVDNALPAMDQLDNELLRMTDTYDSSDDEVDKAALIKTSDAEATVQQGEPLAHRRLNPTGTDIAQWPEDRTDEEVAQVQAAAFNVDDIAGIAAAKSLSQIALDAAEADSSHTLSAVPLVTQHPTGADRNLETISKSANGASPFLFRRKRDSGLSNSEVDDQVAANGVQHDGMPQAHEPGKLARRKGKRSSLRAQLELVRARNDEAASESESGRDDSAASASGSRAGAHSPLKDDAAFSAQHTSLSAAPPPGGAEVDEQKDAMTLSTQAALQQAHLDLIRPSPEKPAISQRKASPRRDANKRSPKAGRTPFADFHDRWAGQSETQGPQISTQALFDAFSPFKITPKVAMAESPKRGCVFSPPPQMEADNTTRIAESDLNGTTRTRLGDEALYTAQGSAEANAGWSFSPLSASPSRRKSSMKRTSQAKAQPALLRTASSLKSHGFKVSKATSASQSAAITNSKGISLYGSPITKDDINRSDSRPQSFSLSQIVEELQLPDAASLKLDCTSSPRSLRVPSSQRRGSVLGWEGDDDKDGHPLPTAGTTTSEAAPPLSPVKDSMAAPPIGTAFSPVNARWNKRNPTPQPSMNPAGSVSFLGTATGQSAPYTSSALATGGGRKSALRKSQKGSGNGRASLGRGVEQEGQQMDEVDIDKSLDELKGSILGSWDVENAMQVGVRG